MKKSEWVVLALIAAMFAFILWAFIERERFIQSMKGKPRAAVIRELGLPTKSGYAGDCEILTWDVFHPARVDSHTDSKGNISFSTTSAYTDRIMIVFDSSGIANTVDHRTIYGDSR